MSSRHSCTYALSTAQKKARYKKKFLFILSTQKCSLYSFTWNSNERTFLHADENERVRAIKLGLFKDDNNNYANRGLSCVAIIGLRQPNWLTPTLTQERKAYSVKWSQIPIGFSPGHEAQKGENTEGEAIKEGKKERRKHCHKHIVALMGETFQLQAQICWKVEFFSVK